MSVLGECVLKWMICFSLQFGREGSTNAAEKGGKRKKKGKDLDELKKEVSLVKLAVCVCLCVRERESISCQ